MINNCVAGMNHYQNQTTLWFGKDSTGQIAYRFNSQGFRADFDFDFVPEYAFFGCSLVFGVGVLGDQIFPAKFKNYHNYGLASSYTNDDIMKLLEEFVSSKFCNTQTKITVIWHKNNSENLENFYNRLPHNRIVHFFCGDKLPFKNCYPAIKNIDVDVSTTHMGPKTHNIYYKTIYSLFNQ
jgi:hypothetical protein